MKIRLTKKVCYRCLMGKKFNTGTQKLPVSQEMFDLFWCGHTGILCNVLDSFIGRKHNKPRDLQKCKFYLEHLLIHERKNKRKNL